MNKNLKKEAEEYFMSKEDREAREEKLIEKQFIKNKKRKAYERATS